MDDQDSSSPPAMSVHDPAVMHQPHRYHHPFDFRAMQPTQTDFAAHLQMPHIPLPLDTPLPPSSYDFFSHGAFHFSQSMPGPQDHPLFEGVVAMHQMLGHDLNIGGWSDMSACNPSTAMAYPQDDASAYACDPLAQWPSPPASVMESTPSPLEESLPHTPEELAELLSEQIVEANNSPPAAPQPLPPPIAAAGYTRFPVVVTGANTHEHTVVAYQYDQKSDKASSKLDPHAADFIRQKLGEQRWSIFSSRLAERRTTVSKPKPKAADASSQAGSHLDTYMSDKSNGATVIDFLVKVEVVKSVLRTYVPHPYNPLKTLSHACSAAPSGHVTLSRSTVLALSGWSNTQFSYWARRAEAISVLAVHDERLRTAAAALERRLRRSGLVDSASPSAHDHPSPSSSSASSSQHNSASPDSETDPEDWVRMYVTGKGLDVIIDEVKKRTGVSPFLRGKHSSLDPFGTVSVEGDSDGGRPAVYMPTFQAEKYVHEVPAEVDPSALGGMLGNGSKKLGKRKAATIEPAGTSESEDSTSWLGEMSGEELASSLSGRRSMSRTQSLTPPIRTPDDAHPPSITISPATVDVSTPSHSQSSSAANYDYRSSELARAMAPTEPSRPKKRRLAPAPPAPSQPPHTLIRPPASTVPPDIGTNFSGLNYSYYNHLQTR